MAKHYTILLTIFLPLYTFSQSRNPVIFGEILGQTSLISVNFDSRFLKCDDGLGFRIGYGMSNAFACKECDFIVLRGNIIPISLNYLLGKNKHHLEFGTGLTAFLSKKNSSAFPILGLGDYNLSKNYGTFSLGYRYYKKTPSLFFGLAWVPIYNRNNFNPRNFGISMGNKIK
ncbi:hypothetical protein [Lacihabitans soyangensis]|uniref:Uncharacterized protein n=1 Tax=Lacihabitans soyangensis TaxID=869394 RepID=A0AAE3KTZ3_9BACT|nr:hypothetical protein [Lacihabitans soyangensis]MCP9765037.1 hypothetical protein [Lacihabitans soyangensis]